GRGICRGRTHRAGAFHPVALCTRQAQGAGDEREGRRRRHRGAPARVRIAVAQTSGGSMTPPMRLEKAELRQLDAELKSEINPDKTAKLQVNPESLQLTSANHIPHASAAGAHRG